MKWLVHFIICVRGICFGFVLFLRFCSIFFIFIFFLRV